MTIYLVITRLKENDLKSKFHAINLKSDNVMIYTFVIQLR